MVIIGLGSNVGNRAAMLEAAIVALGVVLSDICRSGVMETPALLPENAPKDWDMPYLNMAVAGDCVLAPHDLLAQLKQIERILGRQDRGRWSPREIDIDILAMDDLVLDTPQLSLPHRQLLKRPFALLPLAEIAPDWRWPVAGEHYGRTARELAGA